MITIGYVAKPLKRGEKTAGEARSIKRAFSDRLNQLCDKAQIPPKGKNRQTIVAKRFGVSQKGARKWLEGEGLPTLEKAIEIAEEFGVAVTWLLQGRDGAPSTRIELHSSTGPMQSRLLKALDAMTPAQVDQTVKDAEALALANEEIIRHAGRRFTTAPDKRVETNFGSSPDKGKEP
jgi:transcriptional regulator with XRE-family HTH domain